jgi:predicted phage tail protein
MPTPVTSDRSVTLTWNRPASDNGSPIVGYVVTPYLNGVTALSTQTFMETLTTQTVTGLANGSSYRFTVAAINGVGTGPESTMSAAIVVGLGTVPAAPPSVSAVAGSLSATVSWSVPADGGAPITSYRVWVGRPGMWFPVTTLSVGPNATSTTVTGLTAGQVYFFRVAAVNGFGRGPWKDSNAVTILL